MKFNKLIFFLLVVVASIIVASCASKAKSRLIDSKYGIYEISVQSYEDCGGIWHGDNMCIENLKPQIISLGRDVCGKQPRSLRDCGEREAKDGREVYCVVECNAPPKIEQTTLRKARRCQESGGIWVDDRCELDLSQ